MRFSPEQTNEALERMKDAMDRGDLCLGKYTLMCESLWTKALNATNKAFQQVHSVAVVNGTSAIEVAIRTRIGMTKKVAMNALAPPMCWWAAERVVGRGNVVPLQPDATMNVSSSVMTDFICNEPNGMVLAVHMAGMVHPTFGDIAPYAYAVIEDCSHAHGVTYPIYGGKTCQTGTLGAASAWSFFPTKVLATAEAGMVSFKTVRERRLAIEYTNQGKPRGSGSFGHEGYNLRPSELSMALLSTELERADAIYAERRRQAAIYTDAGVKLLQNEHGVMSTFYKATLLSSLADGAIAVTSQDVTRAGLPQSGSTYRQTHFGANPETAAIAANHVHLPIGRGVSDATIRSMATAIRKLEKERGHE